MLMTDSNIRMYSNVCESKPLITNFVNEEVREVNGTPVVSYGLSSFGYDVRLSSKELKLFRRGGYYEQPPVADPKNPEANKKLFISPELITNEETGEEWFILPANTGVLGHTVEGFNIPPNVFGKVTPKSSYARLFISAIVTPLQPGWSGQLVLEIMNSSCHDCKVYVNEGICQINFFEGDYPNKVYEGPYQNQTGTQEVKLNKE